ncbi:hypothetical protein [Rhizobium straminoryzae]|uniref:YfhO family protein n=1 Tax=Rhizobium straminoryzae TaxID=1387186 RepID=A0A549SRN6_9HYPH|nr:hypothetical protein [Rhizobium straminoryzae]TRL32278.1 hypothetical protein FNA46_23735 [Rhizobium straminoryzae]
MCHKAKYQFALIALAGAILLFLRNPDPMLVPSLYGEDAPWSSGILSGNMTAAYLRTRADYLTIGQSLLLHLAVVLNTASFGDSIAHLPQIIAGLSYLLWSSTAALGFLAFRPWIRTEWRLAIAAAILLMPLGHHTNEVLGRALNLGFMFFPISVFLLALRTQLTSTRSRIMTDILLYICCCTNPLAIIVVGLHAAASAVRRQFAQRVVPVRDILMGSAIGLLCLFYVIRFGSAPPIDRGELQAARLVEALVARSILYPFVFPFYSALSDTVSLLLLAALGAVIVIAFRASDERQKRFGTGILAAAAVVIMGTIVTRYNLTTLLQGYSTTFPDRYFYAQNIMTCVVLAWAGSNLPAKTAKAALIILCGVYMSATPNLFEWREPQMAIATSGSLRESAKQVWDTASSPHPTQIIHIPTYPERWSMGTPAYIVEATATDSYRSKIARPQQLTGTGKAAIGAFLIALLLVFLVVAIPGKWARHD